MVWFRTMTTVQLNWVRDTFPLQTVCLVLLLLLLLGQLFFFVTGKKRAFDMEKSGDWEKS